MNTREMKADLAQKPSKANILRSASTQTSSKQRMGFSSCCNLCVAISTIFYVLICLSVSFSPLLQSYFVYVHVLNYPMGSLLDLNRFSLHQTRNIVITAGDGIKLKGWHLLPGSSPLILSSSDSEENTYTTDELYDRELASARRVVIFFHGNAGNRGFHRRVQIYKQLAALLHAHVVVIDYRGFGDSEGNPTEEGTRLDAVAALKWVHSRVATNPTRERAGDRSSSGGVHGCLDPSSDEDEDEQAIAAESIARARGVGRDCLANNHTLPQIILYGHSLGSGVAVDLAAHLQGGSAERAAKTSSNRVGDEVGDTDGLYISGVVLDAAFASLSEAAMTHPLAAAFRIFPAVKNFMLSRLVFKYSSINKIGNVTSPVLLLHGSKDWKIPVEHSRRLRSMAASAGRIHVQLVEVPEAGHDDVHTYPLWLTATSSFMDNL